VNVLLGQAHGFEGLVPAGEVLRDHQLATVNDLLDVEGDLLPVCIAPTATSRRSRTRVIALAWQLAELQLCLAARCPRRRSVSLPIRCAQRSSPPPGYPTVRER
jgi:hypothetical protein